MLQALCNYQQSDSYDVLGAGCIWNDILDREFDSQVGKKCWERGCRGRLTTISRENQESTYCLGSYRCAWRPRFLVYSSGRSVHHDLELRSSCVCYVSQKAMLIVWLHFSQLPIWCDIYRCTSRDLSFYQENQLLAASLAWSVRFDLVLLLQMLTSTVKVLLWMLAFLWHG